jgi:glycosyltransferase involved in cell wall biosynthesis
MTRIVYIYLNELDRESANMNQTLNMVQSFGKISEVTLVVGWVSKRSFSSILEFFRIKQNFSLKRVPISLILSNLFLEKASRFIFCFLTLFHLKFKKYDVIFTRDFGFLFFLTKVPKFLKPKAKIIFESHKVYHIVSEKVSFEQEKKALLEANTIVAITGGIKDDLVKFFEIEKDLIAVFSDGVNTENFAKVKVDKKMRSAVHIVYTGTFKDWKGVDVLVKSVKYIGSEGVKIKLIGGIGEDRDRIEKLVKEEGLEDKISVKGFLSQDDMIRELKSSDIAVIPNLKTDIGERYTSPLKLFEYLACGLPIVCSDLPSMREVLVEGKNALFFEPENEKDLSQKIDYLIENFSLREKMGSKNFEDSKKYSWENRAKNILATL